MGQMNGLELLEEMRKAGAEMSPGNREAIQITKIRYSHDAMIDILVENPWVHQNQLAAHFGYSPAWISTVMATDLFKAKLAERREQLIDPELRASLKERFEAVVTKSLRVLQEKLEAPTVPDNLVLRAVELGAKALGLGGNAPPPAPTYAPDHLNNLAGRLLALQARTRGENDGFLQERSQLVLEVEPVGRP